jgi:hypothetical protein
MNIKYPTYSDIIFQVKNSNISQPDLYTNVFSLQNRSFYLLSILIDVFRCQSIEEGISFYTLIILLQVHSYKILHYLIIKLSVHSYKILHYLIIKLSCQNQYRFENSLFLLTFLFFVMHSHIFTTHSFLIQKKMWKMSSFKKEQTANLFYHHQNVVQT